MLDALAEIVVRLVVEIVFSTILYSIGWVMLKVITLGHYPPPPPKKHNEGLVALFPIATFFIGVTLAFS
jgi:hypothetical protein